MNAIFAYLSEIEKICIQLGDRFCYDVLAGRSAPSISAWNELILATSAGFTEEVKGHKLEKQDALNAFEKAIRDWNISFNVTGYQVKNGFGKWSIR